MSVRDPGYDPRQEHPRSGAHPIGPRAPRASGRRAPSGGRRRVALALVALAAAVLVVALTVGGWFDGPSSLGAPVGTGATPSPVAAATGSTPPESAPSSPGATPSPTDPTTPAPTESPVAEVETDVALVPVTHFRTSRSSVRPAEIEALAGGESPFDALVLVEEDADAILGALGLDRAALGKRLVTVASAEDLAEDLAANRTRVAFLRADQVGPSVRALGWGNRSLFGVDRVKALADWPLTARLMGPATPAYDPQAAWTLVAGGDILLDRGVALAIDDSRRGADFPFDGGTVEITGRCRDCSPMGWDLPYTDRTGNAGVVRELISGADIAIANFENPAPNAFSFHGSGTVFTANPAHIDGLVEAGLDWVSLANNHIGDAGRTGMLQTMRNLDRRGLAHGGLGRNVAEAHEATLLEAGGVTVGLLGYDQIAPVYNAGEDTPGSARMTRKALRGDIRRAREAGADVVIVFPHWGVEYRAEPVEAQRRMGRAAIDAGADMVIGNHPHWVEGMEVHEGKPIWYALGNFVFDQTWSEYTMEGITLELTFRGAELVQARMRPHLIMGKAQPNFMDPAGFGGRFVMDQLWDASEGLLRW